MDEPSNEIQPRDPPAKLSGRLRLIGPSIILTATLVGSGELVVTTLFGSRIGFVALWLILATCVLKVVIQETLGRYAISSGDTTLEAFDRLPGPRWKVGWPIWLWILVILLTAVQLGGVAVAVGEALNLLIPNVSARQWAPIVCALSLALLYSGHYSVVERASTIMVSLFSALTIVCALLIQGTDYAVRWQHLIEGLQFKLPPAGVGMALAIVGAVGLSATELMYYPYWCLEKGYARFIGVNDRTDAWRKRARGWIKVMQLDCYVACLVYTTTTLAFYFLGAAILHQRVAEVKEAEVILTLSRIYTQSFGPFGFFLFVFAAILVLYSTLFVAIASYSRLMTDTFKMFGAFPSHDSAARTRWLRFFLVLFSLLFAATSQLRGTPLKLIVFGLSAVALLLPVVCFAAIWLRYQRLDPGLRPSPLKDIWLWVCALVILLFTFYFFAQILLKAKAPAADQGTAQIAHCDFYC